MVLRITTWNVNGIRNPFGYQPWRDRRTFEGMFDILEADIVIMQELKIQRKDLRDDMVLVPGWDCYFSLPKHKKGYSGVGIYTRQAACAPIRAEEGVLGVLPPPNSTTSYCNLPEDQHIGGYLSLEQIEDLGVDPQALDAEGRCVVVEFPAFVLFGLYSPANSNGLRDDFRFGFLSALDIRIRNLIAMGKRVVVTGDLNVSREEIDTASAEENMKKEGITREQYLSTPNRRIFNQLLEGGIVIGDRDEGREVPVMWDICRGFHPGRRGMYTHWEQKINARPGNFGSRIDFVLCSLNMKPWFCDSNIQEGLMGSDHCPVYAVIKDQVDIDGKSTHVVDIMSTPGTFVDGQRIREYNIRDIPQFSGKLLPEFDKRRSIKDMFGRKQSLKSAITVDTPTNGIAQTSKTQGLLILDEPWRSGAGDGLLLEDAPSPTQSSQATVSTITSSAPVATSTPERKRTAPAATMSRALKRTKSNTSTTATVASGKAQQSLKGFFRPKVPMSPSNNADGNVSLDKPPPVPKISPAKLARANTEPSVWEAYPSAATLPEEPTTPSAVNTPAFVDEDEGHAGEPEEFVDPIVSKESWSKLFTKPSAPRCEGHDEPCKMMKTKKTGFNCGRDFWMCTRPLGPSGAKERNTQWRCGTFIWSSDWNGSGERDP